MSRRSTAIQPQRVALAWRVTWGGGLAVVLFFQSRLGEKFFHFVCLVELVGDLRLVRRFQRCEARVHTSILEVSPAARQPVMELLDLLGRRWALRILWELRDGVARNFRELRLRCDQVSPTVLTDRLRETSRSLGEAREALKADDLTEEIFPLAEETGGG